MKTGALARVEWDFAGLPDDELAVCQLWEYARESPSIRQLCERTSEAEQGEFRDTPEGEAVRKEFYGLFGHLGRAAILFQEGIYGFESEKQVSGFQTPFPQPWQSLSPEQRAVLCATANWDARTLLGLPGFRRAQMPHVTALSKLFKPEPMAAVFGEERPSISEFFHAGGKLRRICPNILSSGGSEVLVVEIEWGKATNEELAAAFAEWLKENEPPGVPRPDRRGRKRTDVRAALDWLGMLRLLHGCTRAEMPRKEPAAERRFGSRDWYRDRKRAGAAFRKLFPFLPKNERPLAWVTKGSRRK